jgi:anaerobic magnesium-protoporphyrin IX monomethyl ester cyclase
MGSCHYSGRARSRYVILNRVEVRPMRVFFGNPPWLRPGWFGVRAGSRWPHFEREGTPYMPFPFHMAYASATLKRAGHDTTQVDGCAEMISDGEFMARFNAFKPQIAVLEISTASLDVDRKFVRMVREAAGRDVTIVWVGAHSWLPEQEDILQSDPQVDYFIRGEYEYALLAVVEAIRDGKRVEQIPGLLHRDASGKTVTVPQGKLLKNIDEYPWPDREPLPMHKYYECDGALPAPNLQMWASRGCPFKCDFCIWPQLMYGGRNYRVRNETDIVAEVKDATDRYAMKSFYFDDDTFNIGKDRIASYARAFKEHDLTLPWGAMSRADTFDRKTLEIMVGAGLRFIKYGAESGDQGIVDAIEKSLDLRKVRDAVRWAKELGVSTHLTFSFGHPGETWETARKTIDFALELSPESLQFSLMQPFPGTELYKKVKKKGLLVIDDLSKYDGYSTSPVRTETLSPTDLESILREANHRWRQHTFVRGVRKQPMQRVVYGMTHPRQTFNVLREVIFG